MSDRLLHMAPAAFGIALFLSFGAARTAPAQGIGLQQLLEMMDWGTGSLILLDKTEYVPAAEGRPIELDAVGWYGGQYDRLWFLVEGEQLTADWAGKGELHAYYGRLVTPYWDALAGVRFDGRWGEERGTRAHLALGLVGLAPLRFELSPTVFLSRDGDLSARLEAEYQILITQRLVAEPELELNAALQEVSDWEIESGLGDVELGLRLRYEIRREFAPYAGLAWVRRVGGAVDPARTAGHDGAVYFVVGVRTWR